MSQLDLSDKGLYDMINGNPTVVEKAPMMEMEEQTPLKKFAVDAPVARAEVQDKPKSFKIVRSLKTFVIFILAVALVAAFIYFTIYRLGWGVKECMNKNYHDCAALLTPEIAPLAATGLLALI
jgi:hypothetical protein